SSRDVHFARMIARRTWRFFETFVGPEDNWLPPDNFQEDPLPVVAHRTSPTNIGLLSLATLCAHDLGYVGTLEFVERQELTFATLAKLQRFHGHFFNWYDTTTLQPLHPQYVSTVDSGNLAGHLMALRQACIDFPDTALFDDRVIRGFVDVIDGLSDEAGKLGSIRQRTEVVTVSQLRDEITACQQLISNHSNHTLDAWHLLFRSLTRRVSEIEDIVNALSHEHGEASFQELRWWLGALHGQVEAHRRDGDTLLPWGRMLRPLESLITTNELPSVSAQQPLLTLLQQVPNLGGLADICDQALVRVAALRTESSDQAKDLLDELTTALEQGAIASADLLRRFSRLSQSADQIKEEMDFDFLFDGERKLFTIGYNVSIQRPDNSYYDLLASEARVASFVAIAKGDVRQEHWFRMGRQLTSVDGGRALISWTGSIFEYLMPLLIMRDYGDTLLDETYRSVVRRQIEYGQERGVPWGISEAAYNARDLNMNYQY